MPRPRSPISISPSTNRRSRCRSRSTARSATPGAVSTGRPGYDTPNGAFKVNRMRQPLLPGVGQCADAAHHVLRHARPRHPRLLRCRASGARGVARLRAAGAGQRHGAVQPGEGRRHGQYQRHHHRPHAGRRQWNRRATGCPTTKPSIRRSRRRATTSNRRLVMASSSLVIMASNSSQATARRHRPVTASSSRATPNSCRPSRRPFTARAALLRPARLRPRLSAAL